MDLVFLIRSLPNGAQEFHKEPFVLERVSIKGDMERMLEAENKDASEDDDEDEEGDDGKEEAADEDEEEEEYKETGAGDDVDEVDPEDAPEANGNGDDEEEDDDDDENGDDDDDDEDDEEEEEEDEEEPPAKKRKKTEHLAAHEPILQEIWRLTALLDQFTINFINRELNQAADCLAKYARLQKISRKSRPFIYFKSVISFCVSTDYDYFLLERVPFVACKLLYR